MTRIRTLRACAVLGAGSTLLFAVGHELPASSAPARLQPLLRAPARRGAPADRTARDPRGLRGDAAGLDRGLLAALRRAAAAAADDGVTLTINSGRRSRRHQEELLEAAIAQYGSRAEAARWVAPPDRSAHVSGDAVDIGPPDSAAWLARHGAAYGLCRIYGNEPWHFELRAAAGGCPAPYADPTQDPRLQP